MMDCDDCNGTGHTCEVCRRINEYYQEAEKEDSWLDNQIDQAVGK